MKKLFMLTLLVLLPMASQAGFPWMPTPKSILLQFASAGSGINDQALEQAKGMLKQEMEDGTVTHCDIKYTGFEGETSVCIEAKNLSELIRLKFRIARALPEGSYSLSDQEEACPR